MKLRSALARISRGVLSMYRQHLNRERFTIAKKALKKYAFPYRLNIGCGKVHLSEWINIDLDSNEADLQLDITWPLPFENNSCELIFNEHLLEHLSAEQGLDFLKECRRVLKDGGTLRISMPSLDRLIQRSNDGTWREADWLSWPEFKHVTTRAQMINMAFREWGHQWLYDREEIHKRLKDAGFETIRDCEWGMSTHEKLCGRETRKDSLLIVEAEK